VAKLLGLNSELLQTEENLAVMAGNQIPEGTTPLAQAYAGHQFGHFTMLGDGRAILIGEQLTPFGERYDIQLKGPGRTPYSRRGDGRATLGPMLREYIISEAMYGLRVPTTRSLAVVSTGEPVVRETIQPGAILTRVAESHIRVGTFQLAAHSGTTDDVKALAEYTIQRHYPEITVTENRYLIFLQEVIKRQAALIAKWQSIGFIHGVMNTDNMTISGETIDYGPCAFMDVYDPETVFSSIDSQGRYAYDNQPTIAAWNLARFAETLIPLLHPNQDQAIKLAENALSDFSKLFREQWLANMRAKLGLFNEEQADESLIDVLLSLMFHLKADYTNTFVALTLKMFENTVLFENPEFVLWTELWQTRLTRQEESQELSLQLMKNNNPVVIPRNHKVEEALEAAVKHEDYGVMESLLQILSSPYSYSPEQEDFAAIPVPNCNYTTYCGT
jgi:uncharacterized protein YdiU (UPF0061 family)